MSAKPVVLRTAAMRDVDAAIEYYRETGADQAAVKFAEALRRTLRNIARHPKTASPRYGHELDIPGLRCAQLRRFPHLVFYIEREDRLDVWRILHGERDIQAPLVLPDVD